jgi:hypothetical protein
MKIKAAIRKGRGNILAGFLCLLVFTAAHPVSSTAQTRNQLQQNNAIGYNNLSGAYRKLFYIPEDTLATADSGAIAFKGGILWLKRNPHWVPSAGVNFAIADLTLNGPRNHLFGTNSMKFNFTGLGTNGDGYVGFNEGSMPGITIQGDASYVGPTILFKDLAAPTATGSISSYGGEMRLDGTISNLKGYGRFGPDSSVIGVEYAGLSKRIALWNATPGKYGISIRDTLDKVGMHYEHNYSDSGLAKYGERWIPDVGGIKNLLPDDLDYITEEGQCVDTSFVGASGLTFNKYERKLLPQFKGFRIRVWGPDNYPLTAADTGRGTFISWNKITGELKIFWTDWFPPCGDQPRFIQAY